MDRWVLDVTLLDGEGWPRAFCPVTADDRVMVGLTLLTDRPPGEIVGVFSEHGPGHAQQWCDNHPDVVRELVERQP